MGDLERRPAAKPIPLFLLGVARSGTSFLHHVLAEHPQIRISYEGRLVREGRYLYDRCPEHADRRHFDTLLDRFIEIEAEEPQNDWLVEAIDRHRDRLFEEHLAEPSFPALVERIYGKPHPVQCWGNKILRIDSCPELVRHWPAARFLLLVRDPRAVFASQLRFFRTRLRYASIYWNEHARVTRRLADEPERYLVLRYEDFVAEPDTSLARILDRVGLDDERQRRRMLAAHSPHRGSLEKWRQTLTEDQVRQLESLCFDEMKRFGYTPELATRATRLGAWTRGLETFREYRGRVPLDLDWWRRKRVFQRFLRTMRG